MTCRLRSCGRASDQMRVRGGGLAGELGTPENSCVTGAPSASRRAETMPYACGASTAAKPPAPQTKRSEEHTSELQSLMRISYAVFCLQKKTNNIQQKY